jgi:hypothetical protein
MDLDEEDSPLVRALKQLFPEYAVNSNFEQAYAAAQANIAPEELQQVSADPEMLKMLVSALLS